jgi:glycosidase
MATWPSALLTLPGVPFLYYGEEIGMTGQKPDELLRTPMPWNATEHAGFTTGTPWEPVNDDYPTVNVAAQQSDPDSLLTRYRTLLGIRAAHRALSLGSLDLLESSCGSVLAFLRRTADGTDTVLVLLNFGATDASQCAVSTQSSALPGGTLRGTDLLTGQPAARLTVGADGTIDGYQPIPTLPAHEAAIITLTR